jgi:hypothetical protein
MVCFLLMIQYEFCLLAGVPMFTVLNPSSSKHRWTLSVLFAVVLGVASLVGEANAATYNVWLKSAPNAPYSQGNTKCATGTMTDTGTFNLTIARGCFDNTGSLKKPDADETFAGSGTLNTASIKTNANNEPVLSADGITVGPITISSATATINGDTLQLFYVAGANNNIGARTFTWTHGATQVTGYYYLYNQAQPVPEPETLWLALGGLIALALVRRSRRHH